MLSDKRKPVHEHFLIFVCSVGLLCSVVPIACFLVGILIYRACVEVLLKWQCGRDRFGGLLKQHDALWGVEDVNSLSVVHGLILSESAANDGPISQEDLYNVLEEKLRGWAREPRLAKMFQRRRVKYEYNYLVKVPLDEEVQLQDYLRLVEVPAKGPYVTEADLQAWIADLYNVKMPGDHSNFLEILVSRKAMQGVEGKVLFPILVRIHHSLADGVAIIKLLTSSSEAEVQPQVLEPKSTPVLLPLKNALKALLTLPQLILHQRMTSGDSNMIHRPDKSSDLNFVNWFFEQEEDHSAGGGGGGDDAVVGLLHKIKTIKAVESGTTFQDVLCASLSVSLYAHFASTKSHDALDMPAKVTIGNAVQLGENQRLNNNCAYNFESIPVSRPAVGIGELVVQLQEIRKRRAEVARFQHANYAIIKMCSILPDRFLRRLLSQNRCSLGMSNIPGPDNVSLGGGFSIKHLTFWTPNRFQTRLGLSVFTLQNRLHLGIGGDRCSFGSDKESGMILEGMVNEFERMYQIVTGNVMTR